MKTDPYELNQGEYLPAKWWKGATDETEKFGARPDLATTYMEIGKRFLEETSRYKDLNGFSANEYLDKARPCSGK